jgi:hypothetical protein
MVDDDGTDVKDDDNVGGGDAFKDDGTVDGEDVDGDGGIVTDDGNACGENTVVKDDGINGTDREEEATVGRGGSVDEASTAAVLDCSESLSHACICRNTPLPDFS